MKKINGKKVAILTEDGFEEKELTVPKKALEDAGALVYIISPRKKKVTAWNHDHWSIDIPVDICLDEAHPDHYDALVLPGGVMNPDKLRTNKKAVTFAERFIDAQKPVAAICHGPQLLIETGKLPGVRMTSYPSLRTDLLNAGAHWEDKEMVYDHHLITSRSPADLDAFNKQLLKVLAEDHTSSDTGGDGLKYRYSQAMQ
jgi:protease I